METRMEPDSASMEKMLSVFPAEKEVKQLQTWGLLLPGEANLKKKYSDHFLSVFKQMCRNMTKY